MHDVTFAQIAYSLYCASMLGGFVAALVIALRRHRYARTVLSYGLVFATPVLLAEALILAICMVAWEKGEAPDLSTAMSRDLLLLWSVIGVPAKFIGTTVFVLSGMYVAVRGGRSSLPVLRALARRWSLPQAGLASSELRIWPRVVEALLVVAFALSYTTFVLSMVSWKPGVDVEGLIHALGGAAVANRVLLLNALVSAPIFEEVVFRHFLQGTLGRAFGGGTAARFAGAAIASLLWTLGHAGMIAPEWVKLAQTFPIGLALGWLYERRGLETSIFSHFIFNAISAILPNLFP